MEWINDEIIQINFRFLGRKKIPGASLDHQVNLATKIVVEANEKKLITFIWRFCIKLISGFIYPKQTHHNKEKIMQIKS